MVELREFEFIELYWYQISNWKKNYILKFDDEIIATIEFPSIWTKKAICSTASGDWTIKMSGTFKPELTVRRQGSKVNIIQIPINFSKPKTPLTLPSGNHYAWNSVSMMKGEYAWYYKEEIIFDFKYVMSMDKKRVKTAFNKPNLPDDDLSLLLLIGSYFMILIQQGTGM